MAAALDYLHKAKVLHRDLKTSNIFISRDGKLKLGDFGIAKVLENSVQNAETVVGTPYYMSPEICQNKPYSFKSDLWSLGCILFELCSLDRAFTATNLLGLVTQINEKKVDRIPSHYSDELNDLVQRLLDKDPQKRASLEEVFASPLLAKGRLAKEPIQVRLLTKETGSLSYRSTNMPKTSIQISRVGDSPKSPIQKENRQTAIESKRLDSSCSIHPLKRLGSINPTVNIPNSSSTDRMDMTFQTEDFSPSKPVTPCTPKQSPEDSDLEEYNSEDESDKQPLAQSTQKSLLRVNSPTPEDMVFQLNRSGKARQMRSRLVSKIGETQFHEIFTFLADQKQKRLSEHKIQTLALEKFGKDKRSVIFEVDQLIYLEIPM